jgi:hypothetical protein
MIEFRKGQAPARLACAEFSLRFRASFIDPAFRAKEQSIERLEEIAWQASTPRAARPPSRRRRARAMPIRTTTCQSSGSLRNSASPRRN